jgi:hypothetical protein
VEVEAAVISTMDRPNSSMVEEITHISSNSLQMVTQWSFSTRKTTIWTHSSELENKMEGASATILELKINSLLNSMEVAVSSFRRDRRVMDLLLNNQSNLNTEVEVTLKDNHKQTLMVVKVDSTEESLLGMEAKNHHIMEAVVDGKDEADMVGVAAEEGFAVDVVDTEVDKLKNHGRKSMEEIVVEEGIVEEVMEEDRIKMDINRIFKKVYKDKILNRFVKNQKRRL